jgi:ribonucleoside-diphosphate reductase alpha chain
VEVIKRNGQRETLDVSKFTNCINWACQGLDVSSKIIQDKAHIQFFDGIKTEDIHNATIQAAADLIDLDQPDYTYVAARLLLQKIYKEITGGPVKYPTLCSYITIGVQEGVLDSELLSFDLDELDAAINPERDFQFDFLGLKTLHDRYLIRRRVVRGDKGKLLEMPQHFWMRVAMGLALNESSIDRTSWAIKFYDLLSRFEYVSSTPTLFNAGTRHRQMSSCYLNTISDAIWEKSETHDLGNGIFGSITECALLSKFAGGIGTDWTRVRPAGTRIVGTEGLSSGVVPYLKIFNDTAVAVNQGGKRNGAFAAYLEPWHGDFERFLDLKRPRVDEHLRALDIFPVSWIPDLFMKRVEEGGTWSFFCSHQHPELHELHGEAFEKAYLAAEAQGDAIRTIDAVELWKKMITALVETGSPWITFKDECNRRNPQDHVGVIHNSNLCTEITLNTSDDETAVCNLGSVNLGRIDPRDFKRVIPIAVRMLDNVIDLNFYPSQKSRSANLKHRPIGLGLMGWAEFLAKRGIDWESEQHLDITDQVFEMFSFYALKSSMELAKERGAYSTFVGSKWSKGLLPIDTARDSNYGREATGAYLLEDYLEFCEEEGGFANSLPVTTIAHWQKLRGLIQVYGLRNCNTMALAPTATISNIVGTTPCIEPSHSAIFMKDNHSGLFKVLAPDYLIAPDRFKTAFEIDQTWLIKAAAVRQKWLDQAQSINLFKKKDTRGRTISDWYFLAWKLGLKTTYYLKNEINEIKHTEIGASIVETETTSKFCSIDNPDCEACQ